MRNLSADTASDTVAGYTQATSQEYNGVRMSISGTGGSGTYNQEMVSSGTGITWKSGTDGLGSTLASLRLDGAAEPAAVRLAGLPLRTAADPIAADDLSRRGFVDSKNYGPLPRIISTGIDIVPGVTNANILTPITMAANRFDIVPFISPMAFTTTQVGVDVTTVAAGGSAKILVYASDPATGVPTTLIGSAVVSVAVAQTAVMVTAAFTFEAGKLYWIGVVCDSAPAIRGIPVQSALPIGMGGNTAVFNVVRPATGTFAAPPTPFGARTFVAQTAPIVRLRAV